MLTAIYVLTTFIAITLGMTFGLAIGYALGKDAEVHVLTVRASDEQ